MADYRGSIYDAIDRQFATMGGAKRHFADDVPLEDPTAYETGLLPQVQPVGWVENSDPDLSGGASVTIDSDGITILNGKIFLSDLGGSAVLSPAGFGGSWIDFLTDRVYNSKFAYGTIGNIATSIVSGADTVQEYEDSLSSLLPYWIIDNTTSTPDLVSDSNASYGRALRFQFNQKGKILQDVPISPGRNYGVFMSWRYTGSGTHWVTRTVGFSWRDSTHAIIGTELETGLTFFTDQSTYVSNEISPALSVAPAAAAFLRVAITIDTTSASGSTAHINSVRVTESTLESMDKISFGGAGTSYFTADANGLHVEGPFIIRDGLYFSSSSGATVDWNFTRTGSGLEFDGISSHANLAIRNNNDASLSSADHGLTIGVSSAQQLAIDNNEIQSRDTGAGTASNLFLNAEGGDVGFLSSGDRITMSGGNIEILNGYVEYNEITAPAGASNKVRVYADDSAGTTRLRAVGPGSVRVTLASF